MSRRVILNETLHFGVGAIQAIPQEVARRGLAIALVVTDPDLVRFGVVAKVTAVLQAAGIPFTVYDRVKANPTIDNVTQGVAAFAAAKADHIIALGGGSAIDTAKAIGIITTNPEFADVRSLEGVAPTKNRSVPIIAVPTTAGTAAEVTINYVITDEQAKKKMVCVDPNDIPVLSVVDPELMVSMPKGLTAATGLDALTHAIEGYITRGAWELTDTFAIKAISLIAKHLPTAVAEPGNLDAREGMALAQYVAGMGFSNVGLGIVHSMAHPLGAYYDTPHGVANAVLLPHVMAYNAEATGGKYREIARAMGVPGVDAMTPAQYRAAAVEAVRALSRTVGIPAGLAAIGVKEADLPTLAASAFGDVCTPGNPRTTSEADILAIYHGAMAPAAAAAAGA